MNLYRFHAAIHVEFLQIVYQRKYAVDNESLAPT